MAFLVFLLIFPRPSKNAGFSEPAVSLISGTDIQSMTPTLSPSSRGAFSRTLLLLLLVLPVNLSAALVDKVVAVVNDEVITLSEVEEEVSRLYQSLAKDNPEAITPSAMGEMREQTIDALIDRRLINQRAKATNTTVSDEELTTAIESTRTRMGLDPAEFRKKMELSGMTEDTLKKQLRDQILQSKLVSADVRAKTVVTEEMVRAYYDEHHAARPEKGSLYLLQMGFSWNAEKQDDAATQKNKEDARERAEKARALVEKGQDFKEIAKKFSDLPSAVDGGDLGVLHLDDMAQATRAAIASLKPGETSKIVETSGSYQFFKVIAEEDQKSDNAAFEKAKEDIREKLYQEKLKAAFAEWVKNLRESAYIQKL